MQPGASFTPHRADARRLLFVLSGSGAVDGAQVSQHSAIQFDPGDTEHIVCEETLELLVLGLPPILMAEAAASPQAVAQPA
jgi:redox-sensitive bicupin YhaK (pirin superfamily)